eukprot:gene12358-8485_t
MPQEQQRMNPWCGLAALSPNVEQQIIILLYISAKGDKNTAKYRKQQQQQTNKQTKTDALKVLQQKGGWVGYFTLEATTTTTHGTW